LDYSLNIGIEKIKLKIISKNYILQILFFYRPDILIVMFSMSDLPQYEKIKD